MWPHCRYLRNPVCPWSVALRATSCHWACPVVQSVLAIRALISYYNILFDIPAYPPWHYVAPPHRGRRVVSECLLCPCCDDAVLEDSAQRRWACCQHVTLEMCHKTSCRDDSHFLFFFFPLSSLMFSYRTTLRSRLLENRIGFVTVFILFLKVHQVAHQYYYLPLLGN